MNLQTWSLRTGVWEDSAGAIDVPSGALGHKDESIEVGTSVLSPVGTGRVIRRSSIERVAFLSTWAWLGVLFVFLLVILAEWAVDASELGRLRTGHLGASKECS